MNERDKNIIEDLKKFRILDRDQIIELHFNNVKDSVSSCNKVLKRLQRDGLLEVDTSRRPFHYFPSPRTIKKDSTKIPHFKEIANFYIQVNKYMVPKVFEVEWKVGGKGSIEPDIYMVWNGAPFFVEIQRDFYTKKRMEAKHKRYREYFNSTLWKNYTSHFPFIWIVTDKEYKDLNWEPLRVYQSKDVHEFVKKHMTKKKETV